MMSKTFRRKNANPEDVRWVLREWCDWFQHTWIDPKSEEGKRRLAKYHSDKRGYRGEPGPSWFRNMTVQRPLRREGVTQLKKYLLDPETEVILEAKPPLDYWT